MIHYLVLYPKQKKKCQGSFDSFQQLLVLLYMKSLYK